MKQKSMVTDATAGGQLVRHLLGVSTVCLDCPCVEASRYGL